MLLFKKCLTFRFLSTFCSKNVRRFLFFSYICTFIQYMVNICIGTVGTIYKVFLAILFSYTLFFLVINCIKFPNKLWKILICRTPKGSGPVKTTILVAFEFFYTLENNFIKNHYKAFYKEES